MHPSQVCAANIRPSLMVMFDWFFSVGGDISAICIKGHVGHKSASKGGIYTKGNMYQREYVSKGMLSTKWNKLSLLQHRNEGGAYNTDSLEQSYI
jgi:hypothetical protein